MPTFDNIRDALDHCVQELIPIRHKYIVDILGEREAAVGKRFTLQVMAQDIAKNDGDPGMAMHLPIDPDLPESIAWLKYITEHHADQYERVQVGPVGTTFVQLGCDPEKALQLVTFLTTNVLKYPANSTFHCTVHDEGGIETAPNDS